LVTTNYKMPNDTNIDTTYATRYMASPIPKFKLPEKGASAKLAHQVIKDMRTLDTRPNLNLASFVTTWMEPEVRELMMEAMDVNFVDIDEYPSCTAIANRCVSMLAHLFNSPSVDAEGKGDAVGAPTIGSSEAIMLCGLAMKKRWLEKNEKNTQKVPNLVMGSHTHVCWEKFCRYWDVEPRYVPAEEDRVVATPELLQELCDENTIGVVAVLGSTYNGEFEDVEGIDTMVGRLNEENGWDIGVHVDGASGAFIAPFAYPDIRFDFRLPNVVSINASGHKYGLVYPGIGWAIWRNADYLPESMVFYADYLGTLERTITLNFSRPASNIIAQYYQFLRLGREGYADIMLNLTSIADHLRTAIEKTGHFQILSKDVGIPMVAFRLNEEKRRSGAFDEKDVSDRLRIDGWVVPAYSMPKGAEQFKMMRVTIREDFSRTMADHIIDSLKDAVAWLEKHYILDVEDAEALF
jgi:glutamate decarboxylase